MKRPNATPAQALRLASEKPRKASRSQANGLAEVRAPEQWSSSMDARTGCPRLLTAEEVSAALRVNERTLRRLRCDSERGFPQPFQIGRAVRWRASDLATWMEQAQ